ncbi:MAG TPA: type II secretion system F family protein [Candidatus Hydrogenedentes bacterium]|nr:type II secretion system F family protein [Candidatus Hydrogenedentota bacterium]HNT87201.1 type II secretion system F family protein [Candidatus Hydrogenedentota bacterium]
MPTFKYTARAANGAKQSGSITADNRQAATQALQSRGLQVDALTESRGLFSLGGGGARLNKRVKTADLLVFTRQLSTIVSAGLPLLQGLDILSDQTDDVNFAGVITNVGQDVESGETFSDALRKFPRAFPDLYVSMVRAGEAGGDLDGVLMQLADYLEATEELKRRIKSAMTYPIVAFSMIILIASGLIIWVVPQFAEIFASFGRDLPAPTQILINVSNFLRTPISWLVIIGAIVGIVVFLRMYARTATGRYNLDALKLRLPVFGKLLSKVSISRVTRTLSTLTRSGVPILQALEIVERTAGNEVYARAVHEAGDSVRNGETLADPLARSEVFPAMVTRMIAVGEKTGALEQMLMKISDFYDSEVRATVDSLTSIIEPMLIGMMGIVVGGIVVALFMPILQLSSLVQ